MSQKVPSENKPDICISRLMPSQLSAALELFEKQLREHSIAVEASGIRAVLQKVMADESYGFILAAVTDRKIVGVAFCSSFLGLEHGGESGWLEELYVLPECRQQGVGTQLVVEAIRIASALGWRALDVEVEADHQRVVSLYVRHGFQSQRRSRCCLKLI